AELPLWRFTAFPLACLQRKFGAPEIPSAPCHPQPPPVPIGRSAVGQKEHWIPPGEPARMWRSKKPLVRRAQVRYRNRSFAHPDCTSGEDQRRIFHMPTMRCTTRGHCSFTRPLGIDVLGPEHIPRRPEVSRSKLSPTPEVRCI